MDLDAYLERIRYTGERAPTLEALRGIVLGHASTIPFENLTPLAGRPVELDLEALERKLIHGGRGGYCFEQNGLLSHALTALGFEWSGLGARVLWNAEEGTLPAETHQLLRVRVGAEGWLADVGFGGTSPTSPLRLASGVEQRTPHGVYRLEESGGLFTQQIRIGGEWASQYRFDLRPRHAIDYQVGNWYVSTFPGSHFRTTLVAALVAPPGRLALRNRELSEYTPDGSRSQRVIADVEELREILSGRFGIRLPDDPDLDAALERVTA